MLLCIALVHVQSGALDRAGSLLGYVDAVLNRTGVILFPMLRDIRDQILARAQPASGEPDGARRAAAAAELTEEQALSLAFDEVVA